MTGKPKSKVADDSIYVNGPQPVTSVTGSKETPEVAVSIIFVLLLQFDSLLLLNVGIYNGLSLLWLELDYVVTVSPSHSHACY